MDANPTWRKVCMIHGWTFERLAREALVEANRADADLRFVKGSLSFFSFYAVVSGTSKRSDLELFISNVAPKSRLHRIAA